MLRVSYPVGTPHVEYSLTPLGEELAKQIELFADCIEINLPSVLETQQSRELRAKDK